MKMHPLMCAWHGCTCMHMRVYMCVYMCVHVCLCVCMHVSMCLRMCACVCLCVCVLVYTSLLCKYLPLCVCDACFVYYRVPPFHSSFWSLSCPLLSFLPWSKLFTLASRRRKGRRGFFSSLVGDFWCSHLSTFLLLVYQVKMALSAANLKHVCWWN